MWRRIRELISGSRSISKKKRLLAMTISDKVKRKLLAASGGFCGNPNCHRNLFDFFETGEVKNIEELAHIIGQKENGSRGDDELPLSERDEFENIILLETDSPFTFFVGSHYNTLQSIENYLKIYKTDIDIWSNFRRLLGE